MANTTIYNTDNKEGIDFTAVYAAISTSTPELPGLPFKIGTTARGSDGSEFVFVKAAAAIAQGDCVLIDTTAWTATGITTTNAAFGKIVAVAGVAIANGSYGWVQRTGYCSSGVNVKASCLPTAQLATTATAGAIDDATATGGKKLSGIVILATNTAATAAIKAAVLNWPRVDTTY